MAFKEGLERHGYKPEIKSWLDEVDGELSVIWGTHNKRIVDSVIDCLVLENGYIGDRKEYISCGFNGLNGNADFVQWKADDRRLDIVKPYLKEQKHNMGGYVVIMGQIANDASVKHIGFNNWLANTYRKLSLLTRKKIYYRPHPLDKEPFIPNGLNVISGDLHDVMAGAYCVVTLNSNSGVDAVMAGVPCIAMDKGSMVYKVTNKSIHDIMHLMLYDRSQWLKEMSYTQWTVEEMASGETWEHLRGFYE